MNTLLDECNKLISLYEEQRIPLEKHLHTIWWESVTDTKTSNTRNASEANIKLWKLHSNNKFLQKVNRKLDECIKAGYQGQEFRCLEILKATFIREGFSGDLRKGIESLSSLLEHRALNYRPVIDYRGRKRRLTQNDIHAELRSGLKIQRKALWEGGRRVGKILFRSGFIELVKLRNQGARASGFNDFHEMSLILDELDPGWLDDFMTELDNATRVPFEILKEQIDTRLASYFGIKSSALMPWHYSDLHFQELPVWKKTDPGKKLRSDPVKNISRLFRTLEIDISDILISSDFKKRKNKISHAYCLDLDRMGDVRIIATDTNDFTFISTLLHECGHAAFFKYINSDLPYVLRQPAHTFLTEGVAIFLQNFAWDADFLSTLYSKKPGFWKKYQTNNLERIQRESLIFARWSLVMYQFEKSLYKNPEQDLQKLWWELVSKYQLLQTPPDRESRCDWLSKVHLITNPVYYHNYLLGTVFSSALMRKFFPIITPESLLSSAKTLKIGRFFRESIFIHGKSLTWQDVIRKTFGQDLSPKMLFDTE